MVVSSYTIKGVLPHAGVRCDLQSLLRMDSSWDILVLPLSIFLCAVLGCLLLRGTRPHGTGNGAGTKKVRPPPSPPSFPIIGNLVWLRRSILELSPTIRQLAAEYGPIISLKVGLFRAIFIADRRLAHEILVVRGAAFNDRPPSSGASNVYSSNGHIISSSSGSLWRLLRRNLTAEVLHPARLRCNAPGRQWVLRRLLNSLRAEAVATGGVVVVLESFRNAIFSLLVYMCFGEKLEDEVIKRIERVELELLEMNFELSVFDVMPRLAKLVLRKRWNKFLAIRRRQEEIYTPMIQERRRRKLASPEQPPHGEDGETSRKQPVFSYIDSLLDLRLPEEGGRRLEDTEIVSLCSEFFTAGTDTTTAALQWAMANVVKYPGIQAKLFKEIRAISGELKAGEEVAEGDLQRMPYLKAVILEALRRHPPAEFLLPHTASEEVAVEGYLIPKGESLNVTAAEFGWDETAWERPKEFRPERFMAGGEGEGVDVTGSKEIRMMPFGAGRRICPGMGMAMLHLEYFVANLVKEFQWESVEGEEVDLSAEQLSAVTMKNPLRARISPRTGE